MDAKYNGQSISIQDNGHISPSYSNIYSLRYLTLLSCGGKPYNLGRKLAPVCAIYTH